MKGQAYFPGKKKNKKNINRNVVCWNFYPACLALNALICILYKEQVLECIKKDLFSVTNPQYNNSNTKLRDSKQNEHTI